MSVMDKFGHKELMQKFEESSRRGEDIWLLKVSKEKIRIDGNEYVPTSLFYELYMQGCTNICADALKIEKAKEVDSYAYKNKELVLGLKGKGWTNVRIAKEFNVSEGTIRKYLKKWGL